MTNVETFGTPTTIEIGQERRRIKICWCCEKRQTYLYFRRRPESMRKVGVCIKCWEFNCINSQGNCKGKRLR